MKNKKEVRYNKDEDLIALSLQTLKEITNDTNFPKLSHNTQEAVLTNLAVLLDWAHEFNIKNNQSARYTLLPYFHENLSEFVHRYLIATKPGWYNLGFKYLAFSFPDDFFVIQFNTAEDKNLIYSLLMNFIENPSLFKTSKILEHKAWPKHCDDDFMENLKMLLKFMYNAVKITEDLCNEK